MRMMGMMGLSVQYTQVARILNPIALCLRKIDDLHKTPGLETYIQATFGGADKCKKAILADFFRHGFDGSGAGMAWHWMHG
jgi:hypothetical protein